MSKDIRVFDASMQFSRRDAAVLALDRVEMHVPAGRFSAIIGPSGCGKSTLLRLVADVMQPTAGRVVVGGRSPAEARREHELGFVFQSPTLLPWRTVRQNVELPLDIVGRSRRGVSSSSELIELVGLKGFENALPHELSGGMQQRAAIARALVHQPKILLADEPTGNLDAINANEIIDLLLHINKFGTTVILVTHNKEIVNRLNRRVVTMDHGHIISDQAHGKYLL